jgi:hypothetical protein
MLAENLEWVNEAVRANDVDWSARTKTSDESWMILVEVGHTIIYFDPQLIRTSGGKTHHGRNAKKTSRRARRDRKATESGC